MQVEPLADYGDPRYPTRLEVLAAPELLRRHLPPALKNLPGLPTILAPETQGTVH